MCFDIIKIRVLITFLLCIIAVNNLPIETNSTTKMFVKYPCKGNNDILSIFHKGVRKGYLVTIVKDLEVLTEIKVELDAPGTITFGKDLDTSSNDAQMINNDNIYNMHTFILRKPTDRFTFIVKGRYAPEHPPYIISLKINEEEMCIDPDRTYFGKYHTGIMEFWSGAPNKFCGRRKVNNGHTELIFSGTPSKSGNWPWHVALYSNVGKGFQYICGGTLISKLTVLTAAHCVTENEERLNPVKLKVVLGRNTLYNIEVTSQERTVYQIITHEEFKRLNLDNDIALLTLGTEVTFNNYIQPACLWLDTVYDQLDAYDIKGTVAGWGIDQTERLSNELQEATIPIAPKVNCVEYNPVFYTSMLSNGKKFCAGLNNGTAPCNGDSGGGYLVFVPDTIDPSYMIEYKTGAWYVRGIVSVTLAKTGQSYCEPTAYTVFTDVSKYRSWILLHMK